MKKNVTTRWAALPICAALTFGCQSAEISVQDRPCDAPSLEKYSFVASTSDESTKTMMNGLQVEWTSGDALTVWHAPAGTTSFTKDNSFSTTGSGTTAEFSGTLNGELTIGQPYDWYLIYPYKANLAKPTGDTNGFVGKHVMGARYQDQAGFTDQSHLAGNNLLYAVVKNETGLPEQFTMDNLSACISVKVTNRSEAPLRVHTVIVTVPDGVRIAGGYSVNLTTEPPTLTPAPDDTYGEIRLDVGGGAALAADSQGEFFVACAPFTAPGGSTIRVNVNGYEREFVMPKDMTFSSGKIKTINFNYDRVDADYSGTYFISATGTGNYNGQAYLAEAKSYTVTEVSPGGATGANTCLWSYPVRISGSTILHHDEMSVKAGEDATIENYKFVFSKVVDGAYAGMYTIRNAAGQYLSTTSAEQNKVSFTDGEPDASGYWDVHPDGDAWRIVATKSANRRFLQYTRLGEAAPSPRVICFLASAEQTLVRLFKVGDGTSGTYLPVEDRTPEMSAPDIVLSASGVTDGSFAPVINYNPDNWTLSATCSGCVASVSVAGGTVTYSTTSNASSSDTYPGAIVLRLTHPTDNSQYVEYTVSVTLRQKLAYARVTQTLPDFAGDNYLLVYMSSETEGLALKTDGTYADNGSKTRAVTISNDKIDYDADLEAACRLTILAHKADAEAATNTNYGPMFDQGGNYTLCLQNGNGFGIWGNAGNAEGTAVQLNNNVNKGRFNTMIDYVDGAMQIHMSNKNGDDCFIRYDKNASSKRFVAGQTSFFETKVRYCPVQLFKLESEPVADTSPDTWMKQLSWDTPLTRLSIPGAHDAATSTAQGLASPLAKTQALTISGLWDAGVRAFDLRPAYVNEELIIYHGIVSTNNRFIDVMDLLLQKVEENPNDFAIVIMRHESEGDSGPSGWGPAISNYLATVASRIVPYRGDLTVGDLRGRLLVLSRDDYKNGPIGGYVRNIIDKASDLVDQQAAFINGPYYKKQPLWVQDYYAPSGASDKWDEIAEMFAATAAATAPYPLVMNNTAGYTGASLLGITIPDYPSNAHNVNGQAADYISAANHPVGIVMMDYAGTDTYNGTTVYGAQLVEAVIANNF